MMNTNSKIIIYDDSCPLCAAYTNAFVQTGLIEKERRKKFSAISPELLSLVDVNRAVNEIPVIDANTKQVWYGIDALLEILGQKLPFIKTAGNIKPVKWVLYKLYKFISYNRRVIVATRQPAGNFDCAPDFNLRYRMLFMAFFLVFNTLMLIPLQQNLLSASQFKTTSVQQLEWAHLILVALNITLALMLGKKAGIEYLGQVNMLALITILICVPLIIINKYGHQHNSTINSVYLGMGTIFIIIEYTRRMKFADIIPNYPWVVFINGISIASLLLYLIF
ncbi:MAG: DCC1-like thiol-disulfide oxidoreductase family protein [Ferruginibacter sp.]